MIETVAEESYRYCLSDNDLAIISYKTDKPLSENAKKTLTILSEVFGGLHHLDDDQLEVFDYQSRDYNQYLFKGSLATFDSQSLTLLVIMAHDMAVRFEIQSTHLDMDDLDDKKLLHIQANELAREYGMKFFEAKQEYLDHPTTYLRLLFHQRKGREGRFYERHPTIEDTIQGFRDNNRGYA